MEQSEKVLSMYIQGKIFLSRQRRAFHHHTNKFQNKPYRRRVKVRSLFPRDVVEICLEEDCNIVISRDFSVISDPDLDGKGEKVLT